MKNPGYILNFSTNYNAENYLYYFLPGISSGSIMLFEELTRKQLPVSERHQETVLHEKIKAMKNHWDLYRLNPKNRYDTLKINVIIDYKPWDFTSFGKYSAFTFAKVRYLRKEFEKYFSEYDLSKIVFQYFVIKNKAEEVEELIHFLDEKQGINDSIGEVEFGRINRSHAEWPFWNEMEDCINEPVDVSGKLSDLGLTEKEYGLLHQITESVKERLTVGFGKEEGSVFSNFLGECIKEFKTDLEKGIRKIADLNNFDKKRNLLRKLFEKLSSGYYLRNKDALFRFTIDAKTNASKIRGYESLTAFLVESIDFFEMENPIDFLTNGNGNRTITIEEIEFDEDKTELLLGQYLSFSQQNKDTTEMLNEEKKRVRQYKFSSEIDPEQFFKIDEKKQAEFLTVNGLKHKYLYLFSSKNPDKIRKELENNSIQPLEDYIKTQSYRISESYNMEGGYGLSDTYNEMNFREMEVALERAKQKEDEFQMSSSLESKTYEKAGKKYNSVIGGLRDEFMESLKILPKAGDLHIFFPLILLLVALLGLPLYRFNFWSEALIFAVVFIILLSLIALILWFIKKAEINSKFENIYLENVELYSRFQDQVNELSRMSVNVRKSTLRRKNIKELEAGKQSFLEEQRKHSLYASFYNEIVGQIRENGHHLPDVPTLLVPDMQLPPLTDIRNGRGVNDCNLKVIAGSAEKQHEKLRARLGIIKTIKSK